MTQSSYRTTNRTQRYLKLTSKIIVGLGLTTMLSGCLLTSPFWGQEFASRTKAVPIQTWTVNKNAPVKIECSKAFHGGLYPAFGGNVWTLVASLPVEQAGLLDTQGYRVYSAGNSLVLPNSCWHGENTTAGFIYRTAIRATQPSTSGTSTVEYSVFDKTGLECLGRENGKAGSWFAWLTKGCQKTYSSSTTKIPYAIIRANS